MQTITNIQYPTPNIQDSPHSVPSFLHSSVPPFLHSSVPFSLFHCFTVSLFLCFIAFGQQPKDYLHIAFESFGTHYYYGADELEKERFLDVLATNPRAEDIYNGSKFYTIAGDVFSTAGTAAAIYILTQEIKDKSVDSDIYLYGALAGLTGSLLKWIGQSKVRDALQEFNNAVKVSVNLDIPNQKLGFVYEF